MKKSHTYFPSRFLIMSGDKIIKSGTIVSDMNGKVSKSPEHVGNGTRLREMEAAFTFGLAVVMDAMQNCAKQVQSIQELDVYLQEKGEREWSMIAC